MYRTHFDLNEIPAELREYFEEVEVACLAPWRRVVERTEVLTRKDDWRRRNVGNRSDGFTSPPTAIWISNTTGWQPTCQCPPAEPIPCRVLDCFLGTGTTAVVADRLGRDAIGIELSEDYAKIARARIAGDCPMFVEIEEEVSG
jgi:hypothetical protein